MARAGCLILAVAALLGLVLSAPAQEVERTGGLQSIQLPPGFSISKYAGEIPGSGVMALSPNGDLFVSASGSGEIIVLQKDRNGDGKPDGRSIYLSGLRKPDGIAFGRDDYFYFAEETQVSRVPHNPGDLKNPHRIQIIIRNLPAAEHSTRLIGFDEMGKLYISVGSSCNACIEKDPRRAVILQYDPNGTNQKVFATGIRNAAGLGWHPKTGQLFATVNGRELPGDNFPGDILARVTEGSFHGWPFALHDRIPDPEFGKGREKEIATMVPPELKFEVQSSALGISFYEAPPGAEHPFPAEYKHDAFVGFHGRPNQANTTQSQVMRVFFDEQGRATGSEVFAAGWLQGKTVAGRPAAILTAPDGSLFVSDNLRGCVYRIIYRKP